MNKLIFYSFLFFSLLSFSQNDKLKAVPKDSVSTIIIRKFQHNFKEKYTDEAFKYDYNFDPNNLSLWEKFKHWLTQKLKDWFNIVDEKKASNFTNYFFKTLYVIVFLLVLYFIIKTLVNDEGNWIFGRNTQKVNVNATVLKEELLETDFDDLIQKAKEAKDYRLAIRYYYLKTLKIFTQKEIIDWDNEKTNHDYYNEIKDSDLRNEFAYISYIYDYCWYGEFDLDQDAFLNAQAKFNDLINSVNE